MLYLIQCKNLLTLIKVLIVFDLHDSKYWKMGIMVVMAHFDMAMNMAFMGVFSRIQHKCRSTVKLVSKYMEMVKSYGKIKFSLKLWPFLLYFILVLT